MIYSDEVLLRNAQLLNVLFKLRPILQRMSVCGIPLSKEVLEFKSNDFRLQIAKHWERCFEIIGERFNPDSSDQVRKVLYGTLGLPEVMIRDKGKLKVTTNKFALGKLSYEVKEALKGNLSLKYNDRYELGKIDEFLKEHRRAKKLRQALSFFIDSLLDLHVCKYEKDGLGCKGGFLDKAKTIICPQCAKTGYFGVKSYDPHFVNDKNGVWHAHPSILPLQITGRISFMGKNFSQFKRNDRTWDIAVRDIIKAEEGFKLVHADYSKIERKNAGIFFNSKSIQSEIAKGSKAYSEFAMQAFGLPYEETTKDKEAYTTSKISIFTFQYFGGAESLFQTLVQNDIYFPLERCQEIKRFVEKRYADYYENARETTWKRLNGNGVIRSYQGRLFRMSKPVELSHIKNWRDIYVYKQPKGVREVWEKCCRMVTSLIVQSSSTGDALQLATLKVTDAVDKFMNPKWNEIRLWNGDWNKARPIILVHDAIMLHVKDEYVEPVAKILQEKMESFEELEPYLENSKANIKFDMKAEPEVSQQWDVSL